jgi:hypothetical protein
MTKLLRFSKHERFVASSAPDNQFCLHFGLIGFIFNRFFGSNVGFKGVKAPTEWEAGISFLVVAALCFAIVYFFWPKQKSRPVRR